MHFQQRIAGRQAGKDGTRREWCSVSTTEQQPATGTPIIPRQHTDHKGGVLAGWLSSTDHKVIGYMYLITSFGFFLIAGVMAIIIRLQLFEPQNRVVSDQVYNELFTMHGTISCCCSARRCSSGSRTWSCRCRSAHPTWRSRG